jgi:hypothetical protein
MKKSIGLLVILLLCCILIMTVSAQDLLVSNPSLEWTPFIPGSPFPLVVASYDYGDVVLGESRTATFRLDSIASSEVSVYLIWLTDTAPYIFPDPHADPDREPYLYCWESFCFNPATYSHTPVIMPPGEYRLVDVTFTPESLGEQIVYLYIRSNDTYPPPGSVAYIRLVGTGVNDPTLPAPEFPSAFLPATMIIGFLGAVLLIQRTKEH